MTMSAMRSILRRTSRSNQSARISSAIPSPAMSAGSPSGGTQ
jgi:hypothetical protein